MLSLFVVVLVALLGVLLVVGVLAVPAVGVGHEPEGARVPALAAHRLVARGRRVQAGVAAGALQADAEASPGVGLGREVRSSYN